MLKEITEENFADEVLKEGRAVVVLFKSQWCAHCKQMLLIVKELAQEYLREIKAAVVDIAENQKMAVRFEVLSIPTILIFKGGVLKERFSGIITKEEIIKSIGT